MVEICCYSVDSCVAAQAGGATRVELCANPHDGGTTPSHGAIASARAAIDIKLHVIIRARGGDFVYSNNELDVMERDIEVARNLGADGVVFGCLNGDGGVDMAACERLMVAAKGMATTFHRAFDVTANYVKALEDIIELGFDRILTSGQAPTAIDGAEIIAKLIQIAGNRIVIMPGCGINSSNIKELAAATGASEFHASAKRIIEHNSPIDFGAQYESDINEIRALCMTL